MALLRGHDWAGIEPTRALVGILALLLLLMGWIYAVDKFIVVHQFAYDTIHSMWAYGSSFLYLIFIYVLAICRISPNRSLPRCPYVILLNWCTTNGINSLTTEVVICILLQWMILFGHSCRLASISIIWRAIGQALGPRTEELQLRTALCTAKWIKEPKVLNVAMAKLPGVELVSLTWLARRYSGSQRKITPAGQDELLLSTDCD